jgi:hypothetical protein
MCFLGSRKSATIKMILLAMVCLATLMFFVPACLGAGSGAVSVKVTIGPTIHVEPDGSVRSNVSTLCLEDGGELTVIAR